MTYGLRESGEIEQRKHRRLALRLPAEILMERHGQQTAIGDVVTSDISTGGAYLKTELADRFEVGARVNIRFFLPTDVCQSMVLRNLDAPATVVRVDRSKPAASKQPHGREGIAVQFNERPVFSSILEA